MADVFNLTAAFDKPAYNAGDTMTVSVTGDVTTSAPVSDSLTVTTDDGSTTTLNATSVVNGAAEGYKLTAVTDSAGRTWTISADGKSATATA